MDEISQIRQKIDLVSFISEYLPLKKAGRNFRTLCPFHTEKTPSFTISPERQIWHCFGCNVGGDIFTFLMKYENLEFPEALRILAQRAGVVLKKRFFDSEASRKKEKLYEINHLAAEFYHYLLTTHPAGRGAREYLKKRGINPFSIKTFKLGFVPGLPDSLIKFLAGKKKYPVEELLEAGLVVKDERGRFIDKFRNRIIFPLSDHRGNILGFSGRVLIERGEQPKYINTPETLVYHKGSLLYGLEQTRETVKKEGRVIVVEGEFDLIQSFQAGIKNMVAIKGTALTENQAQLIGRFTENVSLCLDQDWAGELANKRSIEILENADLAVSVVKLPAGKDPDESLRQNPALFKKTVKKPLSIYDFIIDAALARSNPKEAAGKRRISQEVLPYLAKIRNEIVKNHYVKKIARELEVSEEAILRELAKIEKEADREMTGVVTKKKRDREEILAEYLLALVIQNQTPGTFLPQVGSLLKNNFLTTPLYQGIFQYLARFLKEARFSIKKLIESVPPSLAPAIDRSFLLLLPASLPEDRYLLEIEKTLTELKTLFFRKNLREITERIKVAETNKDEKELTLLKERFKSLTAKAVSPGPLLEEKPQKS